MASPALEIVVFAMLGVFLGHLYVSFGAWTLALCVTPVLVARRKPFISFVETRQSHEGILEVLVKRPRIEDPYTGGHTQQGAQFSGYIGEKLDFSTARQRRLHDAALMHDIGKLTVPNQLLNKPGKLTAAEFDRVRQHETVSVALVSRIDELAPCAATITHAGMDGPLESRIVHVADAFDAMTSARAVPPSHGPRRCDHRAPEARRGAVRLGLRRSLIAASTNGAGATATVGNPPAREHASWYRHRFARFRICRPRQPGPGSRPSRAPTRRRRSTPLELRHLEAATTLTGSMPSCAAIRSTLRSVRLRSPRSTPPI